MQPGSCHSHSHSLALIGVLLGSLCAVVPARAQISPTPINQPCTACEARSVHTADLDGDGNQDALSASRFDDKIAWYKNTGGDFGDQQVITTAADRAQSVYAADVDGDGDLDVLSASSGDGTVAWYENKIGESGADDDGFGPQQVISDTVTDAWAVVALPVNADGKADVVVSSQFSGGDDIYWYESKVGESGADDDGFGAAQAITASADEAVSLHVSDVDGDGDADLLSASALDDKIAWYANQGGGFSNQKVISTAADAPRSVSTADADGDGDPDILSASFLDNKIAWYENRLDESPSEFGDQQVITTAVESAQSVVGIDVNGDGKEDVASASRSDDRVAWYESKVGESGSDADEFGPLQTITTSTNKPWALATANIDDNAGPDLLSASVLDDKIAWYENTGSDLGGPQPVNAWPDVQNVASVFATDLTGDAQPDVLSASLQDDKVAWYENTGDGSFSNQNVISDTADGTQSARAADFNGDSKADVVAASFLGDEIAWYENEVGESGADADGFGSEQVLDDSARQAISVRTSDLDGDGDPDVLAAFGSPFTTPSSTIAWYENQIGETGADADGFGPPQVISKSITDPESVFAADLDGDGDPDAVSGSGVDGGTVAWYENQIGESGSDGDGFGPQQEVTSSADDKVISVFALDLNEDGKPDLLAASLSFGPSTISWFENEVGESGADSDGFGGQQVISTEVEGATSVFATDLSGDGMPEVLSASADDDKITWYKNTGGAFSTQNLVSDEAFGARSVYAADLDEDQDADVLSASLKSEEIAWYENTEDVLPVEMAGFEAQIEKDKVNLTWQTAAETGNARFEVQRRVASAPGVRRGGERANGGDGVTWTTVGSVEGAGTTSEAQSYRFTDADLPYAADRLEYRLRQVDTDGSGQFSETVIVERGVNEVELLGTFPNPAQSRATVRYALPEKQGVTLRLYDVLGRPVRTVVQAEQEGRHEQMLDTSGLSSGVYFLRLQAGGKTRTQKLTVVR